MQRYTEQSKLELRIRIPWDSNTAKGFVAAVSLLTLLGLLVGSLPPSKEKPPVLPYEVLATVNFGAGDGTGGSKGNLSPEGLTQRARRSAALLEDAQRSAPRSRHVTRRTPSSQEGGRFTPVASDATQKSRAQDSVTGRNAADGNSRTTIGDRQGPAQGTGRGTSGSGQGAGLGLGDIEWGGRGGAIVVRKVIPTAPENLARSTIVKLRFLVSPQGDVIDVRPLVRGAPEAESAAIRALRQWRFRPLKADSVLVGIITFRFDVN
ncbi:MAG: hypothetical protein KatS3mg040_0841 [Candidatus Kapaibacterium sp.]|nr:MAG: hypothetical protein KatS3mg040_0841 [Candidatus Kapabacteria bacterium]